MKRKIIFVSLVILAIFCVLPLFVYAGDSPAVVICKEGEPYDIYDTDGKYGATFDKNENILTLENYEGNSICFLNFPNDTTIKINVKGTNVIKQVEGFNYLQYKKQYYTICIDEPYIDYKGFFGISAYTDDSNSITFEFNGEENSKLKFENFYNGIFLYNGNIIINNLDIEAAGTSAYSTMYSLCGNTNINDSKITAEKIEFGIINEYGDVSVKNSELNFSEVTSDAIFQGGGIVEFDESKVVINKAYRGIYADEIDIINNTNMEIKDTNIALSSYSDININESNVVLDNEVYSQDIDSNGILCDGATNITDSSLLINDFDTGCYYIYGNFIMNSGKTIINAKHIGISGYNAGTIFNGGATYIDAGEGIALYTENMMERENNLFIDENLKIVEENIAPREYEIYGEYVYTLGEDIESSRITDISTLESLMASKVTIIPASKVSFDGNGGQGTMKDIEIYGEYTLPENEFTAPEGKQFKGWSLRSDEEEIITTLDVTKNITVYAIWEDIPVEEYEVSFISNGGQGTMDDVLVCGEYTLPENKFTAPEGKQFKGWSLTSDGKEIITTVEVTDNVEVYAIWENIPVKEYKVIFNSNGGTNIDIQLVEEGTTAVKPVNPKKDGYEFAGWYLDDKYMEEYNFDKVVNKDINLYAKWNEIKSYTYEYIKGDNQTLKINKIDKYSFTIDGDFELFEGLTIGDLKLERNVDYIVEEGSTIITFTDTGIEKINSLDAGDYNIEVKYSNGEIVIGKLMIEKDTIPTDPEEQEPEQQQKQEDETNNPKTGDTIIYPVLMLILAIIGIILCKTLHKTKKM